MNNKCGSAIAILAGAVILVSAACYNGFPTVYSDTSTYLASGFELGTPFDRPITYGLFLRLASLDGFSMWPIVLLQGLIVSYLIWLTCAWLLRSASVKLHLLVIAALTICLSLSWVVSQIMPDIFTPIMVLAFILLTSGSLQRGNKALVFVIYTVSCCMHLSHPLYGFGLIVIALLMHAFLARSMRRVIDVRSLIILLGLTGASILSMGAAMSKSRSIFFMGAMAEHGILKTFLDEKCPTDYRLCALKDSIPARA